MKSTLRLALAGLLAATAGTYAFAQMGGHGSDGDSSFPEVCRSEMAMPAPDHSAMEGMSEHQLAAMEGMMQMDRDMMQGMMKDDPDVAFVCGMIAHHRGAIDMANVELQYGDDEWAKELARKVIEAQTQEIADMTEWLKNNAK